MPTFQIKIRAGAAQQKETLITVEEIPGAVTNELLHNAGGEKPHCLLCDARIWSGDTIYHIYRGTQGESLGIVHQACIEYGPLIKHLHVLLRNTKA